MSSGHSSHHNFPFLAELSRQDRQLAEDVLGKRQEARRLANRSRAEKTDALLARARRRLRNLSGGRSYAELRQAIAQERLAFNDLWHPPEGLDRDYATHKHASRRRVDKLLRKRGVDRDKLASMGRGLRRELEQMVTESAGKASAGHHLTRNLEAWKTLSPFHTRALPWGELPELENPDDPHRWFLFRPPFFGFLFDDDIITTGDFHADRLLHLHPPSGLVGNECTMDLDDSDGWDVAHVIGEAQLAVAFTPPVAGVIEVLIDAQSTIGTHRVRITDEFGFSKAWCDQHDYLMMDVLHPNVPEHSLAVMSGISEETDGDDLTVSRENLTRGQHYYAQLFSSGPVPAGRSVIVTFGTRQFDICYTNDMELHSRSNFQWFISSVEIRVAP